MSHLKTVADATYCPDCEAHDMETKALMAQIFGPEEIVMLAMALCAILKDRRDLLERLAMDDVHRLPVMRDLDMFGMTLGKLLVSSDVKSQQLLRQTIMKRFGIRLDVQHENCPHGERTEKTPPPTEGA